MFGNKKYEKVQQMQEKGVGTAATARVLASKGKRQGFGGGEGQAITGSMDVYKLKVTVEPDGGAPFDADITFKGLGLRQPVEGEHVPVRYDPADPKMIVLDVAKMNLDAHHRRQALKNDPNLKEKMKALQGRFDAGEIPEGAFRVERSELLQAFMDSQK